MNREQLIEKAHDALIDDAWIGHEEALTTYDLAMIVQRVWAVFEEAHVKDLAPFPGRVKNSPDSSNVPASADERTPTAELDARQAAYQQDRIDWFTDHESEPEIATNAFFRGWDAHTDHPAHVTPTDHHVDHHDDEREALANLIPLGFSERDGVRNVYDAADRILAAGFHRTVHGEPSNVSEPGVSDISPTQMSVKGEPTDAQVLAAVDAFMASQALSEDGPSLVHKNMDAALRAAAAVRGGEHHGNA